MTLGAVDVQAIGYALIAVLSVVVVLLICGLAWQRR